MPQAALSGCHALIIAALAVGSVAASAQDLSTRERQALSAKEADRVARRDLLSILQPTGKNKRGMLRRMRGIGFFTKPYATPYKGMCREDILTLNYGATAGDSRYEDAPLRPYALQTSAWFLILSKDFKVERRPAEFGPEPFDGKCSALSTEEAWFAAEDEYVAARGYATAIAAADRLADGSLDPTLCEGIFPTTTCRQAARELLRPDSVGSVSRCPAPQKERCFVIDGNDTKATIRTDGDDNDDAPITPASIKSVAIEQYIIIT
jgi:hypothetical protein